MNKENPARRPRPQGWDELPQEKLTYAVMVLRAVNHDLRQRIISLLTKRGSITVTEIYRHLRVEQSVASQHLAILRKAGLVKANRAGKFISYEIDRQRLAVVVQVAEKLSA